MNELLSADKLQLFLMFAAPGIVALYVRAQFLAGRLPPLGEGFIAYVMLSVVYQALIFPVSARLGDPENILFGSLTAWLVATFVGPAILGLLLGLNIRKGWTKQLFAHLGINTTHPVDTAWDWRFGGCKECWVLVVLKDDTKWAGNFGPNSFASSDRAERDLYIEQVYEIENDGTWKPRESGVWIAHGEIRSIEFWPKT